MKTTSRSFLVTSRIDCLAGIMAAFWQAIDTIQTNRKAEPLPKIPALPYVQRTSPHRREGSMFGRLATLPAGLLANGNTVRKHTLVLMKGVAGRLMPTTPIMAT